MKTSDNASTNRGRIVRHVWLIGAFGFMSACLTLGLLGWSLYSVRENWDKANTLDHEITKAHDKYNKFTAQVRKRLTLALTDLESPDPDDAWVDRMDALVVQMRQLAADYSDHGAGAFDTLPSLIDRLRDTQHDIITWRDETRQNQRAVAETNSRVHATLIKLQTLLDGREGRQRLDSILLQRRLRADTTADADEVLASMSRNDRKIRAMTLAKTEHSKLVFLCHALLEEDSEDRLSDLKDNRFVPALSRLLKKLNVMEEVDQVDDLYDEDLINEFEAGVFGQGYTLDSEHQTLIPGDQGLYNIIIRRLRLRDTGEDLAGRAHSQLAELDEASAVVDVIRNQAMTHVTADAEHTLWLLFIKVLVLGVCIAILFALSSLKIIRALRRQLDAFQESEQKVSAITTAAQEAIVLIDPDGTVAFWNKAAGRVFGWQASEVIGKPLRETLVPPPYRDLYAQEFELLRMKDPKGHINQILRAVARHKSGAEVPVELSVSPVDMNGECHWVVVARDISRRLENEQSMARLKAAIESASETVIITDTNGVIEYANPAFESTTGYSIRESIGRISRLFASEEHNETFNWDMWAALTQGKTWRGRITNKKKDGSFYDEEVTISPIRSEAGEIVNFVVVTRDVTEQRAMERQLMQAQKLESIGQLAAGIAHEINTPTQYVGDNTRFVRDGIDDLMRLIDLYGTLLTSAKHGGSSMDQIELIESAINELDLDFLRDEIPRAINQTLEGVGRVTEIVRAMKDFSHPGGEGMVLMDLNKAIDSTITVCRNRWKYVAEMEMDFQDDLPQVPCQLNELNQVILNIVVNAADAIGERIDKNQEQLGRITVSTRQVDDWAEVRIRDTGGGIPDAIRGKIFDPFFTTKDVGKGTGQGLSICHDLIVNKHGGMIDVEVEPGVGTTFIVRLPIKSAPEHQNQEAA